MKITASLVLYNSDPGQFEVCIDAFLAATVDGVLHIADNSPVPLTSSRFAHPRVAYSHMGANIGFGAAHNRCIEVACKYSELHLILNPDIQFGPEVLSALGSFFTENQALVAAMPQVLYPDGRLQPLCKLLPTSIDLFIRRFLPIPALREWQKQRYELHGLSQVVPSEVPTLSGCFLMVRSRELLAVDGFDPAYFMYMEDVDLVRRLADYGQVMYYPSVSVVHEYAKGSYKSAKLLRYHLSSAVRYFNKWGWFFDRERSRRNRRALKLIRDVAEV